MKTLRLLLLAALLLVAVPALAAPARISLAEYQARLQQALQHLEAAGLAASADRGDFDTARQLLSGQWEVDAPGGPVTADLDLLGKQLGPAPARQRIDSVAAAVRQHLSATEELARAEAMDVAGARKRLQRELETAKGKSTILEWLSRLFRRSAPAAEETTDAIPQSVSWVALVIGAAAIGLLALSLARTLSANAGGTDSRLKKGKEQKPDRPATPDELLEYARQCAAEGDYKEGLRIAHLAALQQLDRLGLLRYVPAQTNREHEWLLRRKHPEVARTLHTLTDVVEERLYSGHGASAEDFARGESLAGQLWREGEAASRSAQAPNGASSSASSR
ncbi:MAG TPA: DUF4129 domain-containing protein [Symbiobacteriaceae bacterium]|nr:DUF4129 domain-containing protein [Symbiobacteriaceae bacterium]